MFLGLVTFKYVAECLYGQDGIECDPVSEKRSRRGCVTRVETGAACFVILEVLIATGIPILARSAQVIDRGYRS
jgi:hypothetical protein